MVNEKAEPKQDGHDKAPAKPDALHEEVKQKLQELRKTIEKNKGTQPAFDAFVTALRALRDKKSPQWPAIEASIRKLNTVADKDDVIDSVQQKGVNGVTKEFAAGLLAAEVGGIYPGANMEKQVEGINRQIDNFVGRMAEQYPAVFMKLAELTGMPSEAMVGFITTFVRGFIANKFATMVPSGSGTDALVPYLHSLGGGMHFDIAARDYLAKHPGNLPEGAQQRWASLYKTWIEGVRRKPSIDMGPAPPIHSTQAEADAYHDQLKTLVASISGDKTVTPEKDQVKAPPETLADASKRSVREYFKKAPPSDDREITEAEGKAGVFHTPEGKTVSFYKDNKDSTFHIKIGERKILMESAVGTNMKNLHIKNDPPANDSLDAVQIRVNDNLTGMPMKLVLEHLLKDESAKHTKVRFDAGKSTKDAIQSFAS